MDKNVSYTYEVNVSGQWYRPGLRFATKDEADVAGLAKFDSWTVSDGYRVAKTDEPVNARWNPDKHQAEMI